MLTFSKFKAVIYGHKFTYFMAVNWLTSKKNTLAFFASSINDSEKSFQTPTAERKSFERYIDAEVDKFPITSLQPCRQYVVTMQAYLGRFSDGLGYQRY